MYRIEYKKSVNKDIRRIPQSVKRLLQKRIESLGTDPYPIYSKPLKGYASFYRLRVGDYRVLYQINEVSNLIVVYKIGHRRDVYRGL